MCLAPRWGAGTLRTGVRQTNPFYKILKSIDLHHISYRSPSNYKPWRTHPPLSTFNLGLFDPIISNSFPFRYYEISGTNFSDVSYYVPESRLPYGTRFFETRFLETKFLEARFLETRIFRTRLLEARFLDARFFKTWFLTIHTNPQIPLLIRKYQHINFAVRQSSCALKTWVSFTKETYVLL